MPTSELAQALAKVQAELKPIPRTRKGQRGKYADLAAVEEAVFHLLAGNGLTWITKPTTTEDGRFVLAYALVHGASGEREEGEYPLHGGGNAQQQGSDITYARRYALCAVTGAAPEGEDDDGAAAAQQPGRPGRPRQVERPARQVTRTRVTGPDHERLRDGTVEPTPGDRPAQRTRGPFPDDENPWQDMDQEDRPGTAEGKPVTDLMITYRRMGYNPGTERDLILETSERIIGRSLSIGPHGERTHKNLSFNEARTLKDTLDSTDRARLEDQFAAEDAQNATEATQEEASSD